MKIKLINKQTNEEHICSKVVIDGFNYYYNDDKFKENEYYYDSKQESIRQGSNNHATGGYKKKIIATNNPSIDLPKVVNEVEILSQLEFPVSTSKGKWGLEDVVQDFNKRAFTKGYNKSQESHPFSEEDMIEFTEWIVEEWTPNGRRGCWDSRELNSKFEPKYLVDSTKQLLQIWKEKRIKTVYYDKI